jgi:poly-gamma-glutamate synthesis protein (capsule biosynthesis protein)
MRGKPHLSGLAGLVLFALLVGPACGSKVSKQGQDTRIPYERPVEPSNAADPITLFLCGDVMTGRGIDQVLPHPGDPRIHESYLKNAQGYVALAEKAHGPIQKPVDDAYIWGDALQEWERVRPDVRVINLETSVTQSDDAWEGKGIHYRMNPQNVPCLTAARIDCCALANNHVLDWGYAGLAETLETLQGAGIRTAGAGRDLAEAEAPAVVDVAGKGRVLVYSYGSPTSGIPVLWAASVDRAGVNLLEDLSERAVQRVRRNVEAAARPGDVVVVSLHWGSNWGYDVPPEQAAFAHRLIDDAGVDVVHGHSSHHVKGIEVYQGRLILYGCGDLLNDYEGIRGYERFRGDLALMYFVTVDPATGELIRLQMTPMQTRHLRANRASRRDARWLRDVLNREGKQLGTWVELDPDGTLTLQWGS